ncbi:MAG: type VI secretion system tube protein TssD [Lysobacterales bacterium]
MSTFTRLAPSKLPATLFALLILCVPMSASAALKAYMTATGEIQGEITNGSTLAGREGQMALVEYGHSISQAFDNASGLPSGKRQHRAIRVTKEIDKASPKLMNALTNNETLTNVTIRFWHPSQTGQEEQFFTVELLNAHIVNITHSNKTYDLDDWGNGLAAPANETLTITYQKIIWTWEDGSISAEDDWSVPTP